jgi:hypothetical protein
MGHAYGVQSFPKVKKGLGGWPVRKSGGFNELLGTQIISAISGSSNSTQIFNITLPYAFDYELDISFRSNQGGFTVDEVMLIPMGIGNVTGTHFFDGTSSRVSLVYDPVTKQIQFSSTSATAGFQGTIIVARRRRRLKNLIRFPSSAAGIYSIAPSILNPDKTWIGNDSPNFPTVDDFVLNRTGSWLKTFLPDSARMVHLSAYAGSNPGERCVRVTKSDSLTVTVNGAHPFFLQEFE